MITKCETYTVDCVPVDLMGLSTDTKPTGLPNASSFYEMDTKTLYLYDAENSKWLGQ